MYFDIKNKFKSKSKCLDCVFEDNSNGKAFNDLEKLRWLLIATYIQQITNLRKK